MAIISIIGIIGDEYKYSDFITAFASAPDELINLEINSLGGDVEDGEKIADFLVKTKSTNNAAIFEIKTPYCSIFGKMACRSSF